MKNLDCKNQGRYYITMIQRDKYLLKKMGVQFTKPTHGSCCTCQTCGWPYDDCVCMEFCEWEGFGLLWEWANQQNWWNEFWRVSFDDYLEVDDVMKLINPDKFADAVFSYLIGKDNESN